MSAPSRHVLLIAPPLGRSQVGKVPMPPLGLATLAAVLADGGHRVEILDCAAHGIGYPQLEREIAARRPDLVGVTGTTWTRYEQFRAARASKRSFPGAPVVLGGPHVTFTARQTVERIPDVDFVIKGEGEVPFRRLVASFDDPDALGGIPALTYRRNGEVAETTDVGFIEDLDTLPEPARHLLDIPAYRQTMFGRKATTVMTSRGCPVFCSFCSTSVMWGPRNRRRSPVKVLDEIEGLIATYGLGAIWFFDDTLTLNRSHISGILDEIERRKLEFVWYCEIRANTVSRDLLRRMRALGCRYVSFGVESASPRIMKSIHKGITLPQVRNVLDWCSELDIYTKVFFILGLPDETFDDGMQTVKFIKDVRPRIGDVALAAGCSIMPGTEVERYAKARGLMPPDFDWTAEIYYPENRMNNRPIAVPTLFQPQMTLSDLNRLKFEYYGTGALNWFNLKARLKAIRTPPDLWNLVRLGGVFLSYLFRRK